MSELFTRFATRRPKRVLLVAGAVFLVAAVLGAPVSGMLGSSGKDFQDPASQHERADALIESATHQLPYFNVAVLLAGSRRVVDAPGEQRAAAELAARLATQRGFQRAADYPGTRSQSFLSRDGRETVVLAAFASTSAATTAIARVRSEVSGPAGRALLAGMTVRFGGSALAFQELNERTRSDLTRAELFALPLLLVLSFWFFRGLVAALLPPLVGGLAIVLTFLALRIVDQFAPLSVFALNLVTGLGLGLGLDYCLFVVYRYREELAGAASSSQAIERTLRTTGRTVLFSSLTVAAAMIGLLLFPMRFLYSMGVARSSPSATERSRCWCCRRF